MRVPFILLSLSLGFALLGYVMSGLTVTGPVMLAVLSALAALILLLRFQPAKAPPRWIVVDGSNVMHWQAETPSLQTVTLVLNDLTSRGFVPVIGFDANVGYLIGDRYMGPERLARQLGVQSRQVFVAPKGTPADPLLLAEASRLGAPVVTNDRYRDWAEAHPQVAETGFLIRGQVAGNKVSLTLQA